MVLKLLNLKYVPHLSGNGGDIILRDVVGKSQLQISLTQFGGGRGRETVNQWVMVCCYTAESLALCT